VYGIIAAQLVLTAIVAAIIVVNDDIRNFAHGSLPFQIIFALAPFVGE
jgi:FtsH-binding integral membrane protein